MKKSLLILLFSAIFLAGFTQTTGVVYDKKGISLPGVSIVIKGTNQGTVTDIDGKFELSADRGATLVFTFVGFLNQEVTVTDNSNLKIYLESDIIKLSEVVVMGYSSKTRNEISSAVAVLDADQLLDVTTNDVASMLQGKVSGVQVLNASGEPGSMAEIRIRGISTIKPGDNQPLYVVDGIIGGAFNPNDVETMTVLKDAGATGMYGARANKGVIVVTTKKAKSGKTQFEFKSSIGFNIADQGNLKMMSGAQFYDLSQEIYRDPETHQIDKIKFYDNYPRNLATRNFDWVDETFRPGLAQSYYLSAAGKQDKLSYYISGAYYNQEGTFRNTGYEDLNLRVNTDYDFSERVKLTNNINIKGSSGKTYDYMSMYYSYLNLPWDNGLDGDGNPIYVDGNTQGWWSRDNINPLHTIDNSDNSYKGIDLDYDLALNVKITSWLTFNSSNRLTYNSRKSNNFVSPTVAGVYHDKGFISQNQTFNYSGISTNLLKFNFLRGKSTISGLAGLEFQGGHYEWSSLEGKGLPEGFDVPSVASSEIQIGGAYSNEYFQSVITQVNYDYDKRYFLTASFRADETSNFPANNRVAYFPAISASWLVSNESFLQTSETVSSLKVRASYGITGDPDIGASRFMGLFSLNTQYNGHPAAIPYQLANYNLTWEKTNEAGFGFELGLFNRVSLTVDAYKNITRDLLVLAAQPLSQGFEYRWENAGRLTNTGIELGVSAIVLQTSALEWNVDLVFATNKNVLSDIDSPFYTTVNGVSQVYRNDVELYTFVMPKWLGVDKQTGAPLWEKLTKDNSGNIISSEPTSDYAEATPQEVGSALPDFQGGLNTSVKYKNFTLGVSFAYQYGNKVYNFTRRFMDHDGHEPYYNYMVLDKGESIWTKPGDDATHPSWQNAELSRENSSRYLEDGSFIKMRNVSVRYEFSKKRLGSYLQGLAVSLMADNLLTFTNFWGQDPEVTLNQASWSMPGVSDFKYPNSKQFLVKVELKF
jgi:TonB-linked SusC/RagA family outer membrane protein